MFSLGIGPLEGQHSDLSHSPSCKYKNMAINKTINPFFYITE